MTWCGHPEQGASTMEPSTVSPGLQGRGSEPGDVVVRLLDGFDLLVSGRSVPLPLAAQRLVAFLALHERPLVRSFVGASLWLDKTEDRAAANLRSTLWRLRQPGINIVTATSTHVGIDRRVYIDVRASVRRARELIAGVRPVDVVEAVLLHPAGELLAAE